MDMERSGTKKELLLDLLTRTAGTIFMPEEIVTLSKRKREGDPFETARDIHSIVYASQIHPLPNTLSLPLSPPQALYQKPHHRHIMMATMENGIEADLSVGSIFE